MEDDFRHGFFYTLSVSPDAKTLIVAWAEQGGEVGFRAYDCASPD